MADYTFRLRFNRASTCINIEEPVKRVVSATGLPSLTLKSRFPEKRIMDSKELILEGGSYPSKDVAEAAGIQSVDALAFTLAKLRVGVDFGRRGPKSFISKAFLDILSAEAGTPVLFDVHGLMIYECEPPPRFASFNGDLHTGVGQEAFERILAEALERKVTFSERERLALDLYNFSYFLTPSEARLIMLVMATEALIELNLRCAEAVTHVEVMIQETENSSILSEEDKKSMCGSLRYLRHESINQAGRRLCQERLGNRVYGGKSASAFFSYAYGLRSKLVHGENPPPNQVTIGDCLAQLEFFVSDLLTVGWKIT